MLIKPVVLVALAALATAPQAVRVIEAAPAPAPTTARGGPVDPVVCRSEPVTGTRFERRVCRSVRTSDARAVDRETLRRLQGVREADRGQ